nr:hypothetical protein [Tanacetum cinerariifolium]
MRAEIEVLRSERLAYEQEGIQTRKALDRSEAYCRALEVRVVVLETHARRLEWQRQAADDLAVQHIMRTQALEAGARDDTLEDTARTRRGQTLPPTNPNNMTPEAVQTMIDQALLRNSGGGDGSHSSHAENPRNMHTALTCPIVKQVGKKKTYCGSLWMRSRDITRLARRGRHELRSWKFLEPLEAHGRPRRFL